MTDLDLAAEMIYAAMDALAALAVRPPERRDEWALMGARLIKAAR